MAEPTHYAVLGVSPTATPEEVRAAWLAVIKATHPDTHPDDPVAAARCAQANAAFDVIGNPESRKDYDLFLARPPPPPPPPPRAPPPVVPRWSPSDPFGSDPRGGRSDRFRHDGLASSSQWTSPVWYDRSSWSPGQERLENEYGARGVWGRDGMPRWGRR
jgi:curved DNA-binding protein CbpA